uniref:Uncharacterized protein n=1 Tax=Brassica oleracea TaxID=3712 RepID=A0A3P6CF35_BRAOL|nr:unnamed protein product [Brassica oleracea]
MDTYSRKRSAPKEPFDSSLLLRKNSITSVLGLGYLLKDSAMAVLRMKSRVN